MRLAIIGRKGQLAQATLALAERRGLSVISFSRKEWPLEKVFPIPSNLIRFAPTHLLLAAAYTAVDKAELEPGKAFAVNALSTARIATWCKEEGVRLLYPSTDYVFDGEKRSGYWFDDLPNPLSAYGSSKWWGEQAALSAPGTLVARTSWLYGLGPSSFPFKVINRARKGEVAVVDDQFSTPTWVGTFARLVLDLAAVEVEGIVHASAKGKCSWHTFAQQLLLRVGYSGEVGFLNTPSLALPARRPIFSQLCENRWEIWGITPPPVWEEDLDSFFGREIREETTQY
ncbi:dTDP-4-dehydrorhamnose reductase [bacterium]|nr:dTDP-4-dehydrorhamnose reductase [bacterium]